MSLQTENEGVSSESRTKNKKIIREVGLVYLVSSLLILVLIFGVAPLSGFVQANLSALVAAVFLYLPILVLRRRVEDPWPEFGMTTKGAGKGALLALGLIVMTAIPFVIGFHLWEVKILKNSAAFELKNYYQWPLELTGRPDVRVAKEGGVFIYREGPILRVRWGGKKLKGKRVVISFDSQGKVELLTGKPFLVISQNPNSPDQPVRLRSRWTVTPKKNYQGADLRFPEDNILKITVEVEGQKLGTQSIFLGAGLLTPEENPFDLSRGLNWFLWMILTQFLLVALPEEFFYRGYIQTRLNEVFPKRIKILFVEIGPSIIITSLLFAVGHFIVEPNIQRLAVFFPSLLFGWLRDRSGTIVSPVIYHALCNMLVEVTVVHYF